ncbi:serine/threonine protein kinase [Planktothrix agardhii CCAP 1459/11A]|uniref:Serine/threonine protein kinase n=1 Tax=Planktothrix agardhii CCAP 1459/11A TaxID=282420 RepID=A0A479ZPF3_PLAAG|nr:serine/threonine-protein kinase [Planktothrix agardhii]GCL34580.1 serine/threonine protein kinase [Planktothrix agardhii CCAP 1459/11A]
MNLTQEMVLQNGKYRIDAVLGRGEFGVTYQGTHPLTNQTVVIKTLHPKFMTSVDFPKIKRQFITFAQGLSQCHHPNIVRVLDLFEEQGLPYMVMNYIPGETLEETLKSSPRLSVGQALNYISQISSALRKLHQQGLLHCHLQPRNIRLHGNTLTLVDFGLTNGFIQHHPEFPIRNRVLSVGYASLEHYLPHQQLTPATDIYGLSAILYYLLTGEPPLEAPLRVNEATQELLNATKPNLRRIQPTLSVVVERLIYWGLEIEPGRRPQNVDQWIAFLPIETTTTVIQSPNTLIQPNPVVIPPKPVAVKPVVETPVFVTVPQPHPQPKIQPVPVQIPDWETIEYNPSLGFLVPILFLVTSLFFGWVGFDLTRRYGYIVSQKTKIQINHPFANLDSTEPMFENPSIQTQAPSEVAPQRSVEEPLEDGDYSIPKPADLEAKTEEQSPVDQYSNSGVVAETLEKSPSTDESKIDQYLLPPSEVESEPPTPTTDYSVSTPVNSYSGDPTVQPDIPTDPNYSQSGAETLPPQVPPAEGGGYVSEESAPNYYTEPTIPVEPQSRILSEETVPINSAPNDGIDPSIPYSPLTIPLKN